MAKQKNNIFAYKEDHNYYVVLTNGDDKFLGQAICHEDDYDFESDNIGYTIAHFRATIKMIKYHKKAIKNELKGLKQLYYSTNKSKNFIPNSYMVKMLFRQINLRQDDIEALNEALKELEKSLKEFIESKDKYHQQVRDYRAKQKEANS